MPFPLTCTLVVALDKGPVRLDGIIEKLKKNLNQQPVRDKSPSTGAARTPG